MSLLNWKFFFILSLAILPFSFALNPTSSIDLPVVRVLFPLIFLIWLLVSLFNEKIIIDTRPRFWLFSFFLFFCGISIFWADNKTFAITKILFLFSFFPVYFLTYAITQQKKDREKILKTFVLSSFFTSLFALLLFSFQFLLGIDSAISIASKTALFFLGQNFSSMVLAFPSWLVNIGGKTIMRTFGSFPDPHLFSLFINLAIPFAFYFWQKTSSRFYFIVTISLMISSLLSFSRAAYLSLFLGGLFSLFLFTNPIYFIKKHFSKFIGFIFAIFLLLVVPNPLTERFASSFDVREGSNSGRIEMWKLATETTLENPFGVGIGNFASYNFPTSSSRDPIYAHNLFLDFSAEIGILGAILLFLVFLCPVLSTFKKPSFLAKVIATTVFVFFIHSLFETPFYSIRVFPLFLLILAINTND